MRVKRGFKADIVVKKCSSLPGGSAAAAANCIEPRPDPDRACATLPGRKARKRDFRALWITASMPPCA